MQLSAQQLIDNGGGSIILMNSAAGLKGWPFVSAYAAAKHGVVGLMRAYATELAEYSIRVNAVHPTGIATPMAAAGSAFGPLLEAQGSEPSMCSRSG